MRIAIHQPDYLPWCGFFYKMARVDLFVILDDCGFSQRRATHRVQIRRPDSVRWLTVPVGKTAVPIIELVPDPKQKWQADHWNALHGAYHAAPYWREVTAWLKPLLLRDGARLADFNIELFHPGLLQLLQGVGRQHVGSHRHPEDIQRAIFANRHRYFA